MAKVKAHTNRPVTEDSTVRRRIARLKRHLRMHGDDAQALKAMDKWNHF